MLLFTGLQGTKYVAVLSQVMKVRILVRVYPVSMITDKMFVFPRRLVDLFFSTYVRNRFLKYKLVNMKSLIPGTTKVDLDKQCRHRSDSRYFPINRDLPPGMRNINFVQLYSNNDCFCMPCQQSRFAREYAHTG